MNCKKLTHYTISICLMFLLIGQASAFSLVKQTFISPYSLKRIVSPITFTSSSSTHLPLSIFDSSLIESAVPNKKQIAFGMAQEVFTEICRLGIREPQIVMRQALLETGKFKAPFLMKRNNLFGFRAQSYLSFSHWKESVRYYSNWQNRHYKNDDTSYFSFLTRKRYGAPNYTQHLSKINWNYTCSDVGIVNPVPANTVAVTGLSKDITL